MPAAHAPQIKKSSNASLAKSLLIEVKGLGLNISQVVEAGQARSVSDRRAVVVEGKRGRDIALQRWATSTLGL